MIINGSILASILQTPTTLFTPIVITFLENSWSNLKFFAVILSPRKTSLEWGLSNLCLYVDVQVAWFVKTQSNPSSVLAKL